jgi:hypothetical protein
VHPAIIVAAAAVATTGASAREARDGRRVMRGITGRS